MIYEFSTSFWNKEDSEEVKDQLKTQYDPKTNKTTLGNDIPTICWGGGGLHGTVPCVVSLQTTCESFEAWGLCGKMQEKKVSVLYVKPDNCSSSLLPRF